jgi:hypothetical protein
MIYNFNKKELITLKEYLKIKLIKRNIKIFMLLI